MPVQTYLKGQRASSELLCNNLPYYIQFFNWKPCLARNPFLLAGSHTVSVSTRPAYLHPKQVKQRRNPHSLFIESQEIRLWEKGGGRAKCSVAESADNAQSQQGPFAAGEDVGKDDFVFFVLFCFFFFTLRGVHKFRASSRLKPHLMERAIILPAGGGQPA